MLKLSRRQVIATGIASGVSAGIAGTLPLPAFAAPSVGATVQVRGEAVLMRAQAAEMLKRDDPLFEGDLVRTGAAGFAELLLITQTRINLGPESEIGIDRFIAELGGEISIGGQMLFDRPDDLPKLDLTFRNAFAQIGVRGTRFFAGQSKGVFAVFVDRGEVAVTAAGVTQIVAAGAGVDVVEGAAPTAPVQWGQARIDAAFASLGL